MLERMSLGGNGHRGGLREKRNTMLERTGNGGDPRRGGLREKRDIEPNSRGYEKKRVAREESKFTNRTVTYTVISRVSAHINASMSRAGMPAFTWANTVDVCMCISRAL